jgi:hypothetical protein
MVKGDNPHTGPFYIEGAAAGDTLAVKILDLQVDGDQGVRDIKVRVWAVLFFASLFLKGRRRWAGRPRFQRGVSSCEDVRPEESAFLPSCSISAKEG